MTTKLTTNHWTNYWANGSFHSMPGLFNENYTGATRKFWELIFARLPHNAKIIDLGTGNGALALLALEYSQKNHLDFEITGIDSATISPHIPHLSKSSQNSDRIKFLSNRTMENTGLPPLHFHLAMAQYSLEYACLPKAVQELDRILIEGSGIVAAVLHHENSVVLQQAKQVKRQINHCNNSQLIDLAKKLIVLQNSKHIRNLTEHQHDVAYTARQFNKKLQRLQRFGTQMEDSGYTDYFVWLLTNLVDPAKNRDRKTAERLHDLERWIEESAAYKLRLNDLQSAAFSPQDYKILTRSLVKKGFEVAHLAPLFHNTHFIGFSIRAHRTR